MSYLIDSFIKNQTNTELMAKERIDGEWYIVKPLNYYARYRPFRLRLIDAWRVLWCRAIAVHYKEDLIQ